MYAQGEWVQAGKVLGDHHIISDEVYEVKSSMRVGSADYAIFYSGDDGATGLCDLSNFRAVRYGYVFMAKQLWRRWKEKEGLA